MLRAFLFNVWFQEEEEGSGQGVVKKDEEEGVSKFKSRAWEVPPQPPKAAKKGIQRDGRRRAREEGEEYPPWIGAGRGRGQ